MASFPLIVMIICGMALVGILLAVLVVWMQNRSIGLDEARTIDLPQGPSSDINREAASPLLAEQIRLLLIADNKIEAIRVYREATQSGLKTAKEAVEAFERGGLLQIPTSSSSELAADAVLRQVGLQAKIEGMVHKGNKLQAIAIYRRETGVDLKAAKDAIEALERGEPWVAPMPVGLSPQVDSDVGDQVRELLRNGKKIDAIKLVREKTGMGFAEAKTMVESYEANL